MPIKSITRISLALVSIAILTSLVLVSAGYYLLKTNAGAKIMINGALIYFGRYASIDVKSVEGSLWTGLVLKDISVHNWPMLGPSARVLIQTMNIHPNVRNLPASMISIFNGRIELPGCEPIVLVGEIHQSQVKANVYSKGVDVAVVAPIFVEDKSLAAVKGSVSNLDVTISGQWDEPLISGKAFVDRIDVKGTVVREAPVHFSLSIKRPQGHWQIDGPFLLDNGLVNVHRNTITLQNSSAVFHHNLDPELAVVGVAKADEYTFDLTITGTMLNPVVKVVSDPYLPEDQARVMLGLGKWAFSTVAMNASGEDLKMEMKKKIADDFALGFQLEQMPHQKGEPSIYTKTVEGELSISDHVSVDISQTLGDTPVDEQSITNQDTRDSSESRLMLKYKKRF